VDELPKEGQVSVIIVMNMDISLEVVLFSYVLSVLIVETTAMPPRIVPS